MTAQQQEFVTGLNFPLPADFQQALFSTDGSPIIERDSGEVIYGITELEQFNTDYEASEHYPGFYLIGSNGGGEAYAIEKVTSCFVKTPFIGHDETTPIFMGASYTEFLAVLETEDTDG